MCVNLKLHFNVVLFLGDYSNPSFTNEESASHREDPGDYRQPVPVYQLTRPSSHTDDRESSSSSSMNPPSQTVQRHNIPFFNGSLTIPKRDFSSNLPVSSYLQKPRRSVFVMFEYIEVFSISISLSLFLSFHRLGSAGLKSGHPGTPQQCTDTDWISTVFSAFYSIHISCILDVYIIA